MAGETHGRDQLLALREEGRSKGTNLWGLAVEHL
jgi:hypothetical protein